MNDGSFQVTLALLVVLTLLVMEWAPTATDGLTLSDTPTPTPHHDYLPLVLKYYTSTSTPTATPTSTATASPTPTHTPVPPTPVAGVTIPLSEMTTLYSEEADQDYTLYIALPVSYSSSGETYPVIYLLDGNIGFPEASGIVRLNSLDGSSPEVILVGIGYGIGWGGDMDEFFRLRQIDLTPPGAERYLNFIQGSIIPYVEDNYRADPADHTLMGHSLGGLFTVYALFHAPETFNRYIAASPALFWDDRVAFDYEEEFARDHSELPVKLFLSVGGLEEDPSMKMVSNLEEFHENLESRNYDGLEMEMIIFEGETHVSVLPGAYSRGFRTVFQ